MKRFSKEFQGYNKKEVDLFIDDTLKKVELVLEKVKQQEEEINSLTQELSRYKEIENTLDKTLENAKIISENIKSTAKYEASLIIEEAKANADRIINESIIRATKIEKQTQSAEENLKVLKNKLSEIIDNQQEIVRKIELLNQNEQ